MIGRDHHMLALQPVVHHSCHGPDQSLRQDLQNQGQRHRTGMSGQLQQQGIDRKRVEPVTDLADDLRQPEPPEIAIAA